MSTVGIVDYGMGNLLSVYNAFQMVGADAVICTRPEELADADRIVLPGVGAFGDCISVLNSRGFSAALDDVVLKRGRPIMGICLGLQAMARRSFEGGEHAGLGWFEADVVRITPSDSTLRVPHVGWNDITCRESCPMFKGLPARPDFYFVHSFYMKCADPNDIQATADYGGPVLASVLKNNIFATQFHPEKSQEYGQRVIENFLNWKP